MNKTLRHDVKKMQETNSENDLSKNQILKMFSK